MAHAAATGEGQNNCAWDISISLKWVCYSHTSFLLHAIFFFTLQFLQNEIEGKALFLTKEFNHHHKLKDLAAATSAEVSKIHQVRKIACYPRLFFRSTVHAQTQNVWNVE